MAKGLRWRVGNGRDIRVWKDPWIPKLGNFLPKHVPDDNAEDTRVNELIEEDTKKWNIEKINEMFPANVAEMIQGIPIGNLNAEDILVWHQEENGVYSVRSGYRMLTGYY